MIPVLWQRPSNYFFVFFNNDPTAVSWSMTTADGVAVTSHYHFPNTSSIPAGAFIDWLKIYVDSGSGPTVIFDSGNFISTDRHIDGINPFDQFSPGWVGAGTYQVYATARSANTGQFDQTSDLGFLTVT